MTRRARSRRAIAAVPLTLLATTYCGSRTPAGAIDGPPECYRDEDCEGADDRCRRVRCSKSVCEELAPVDCDDKSPCTSDVCDSITGACSHPDATLDLDRDGHRAPLPGKRAGEVDACGDDCDDRNASAFPGGIEVCDGVDNDCNGIVDDGGSLAPSGDAVLVSDNAILAEPSSLVFGNGSYLAAFTAEVDSRNSISLTTLSRTGSRAAPPSQLSSIPADASGGALVFIGDRFGIAWNDRREQRGGTLNYETYFNLLNFDRTKRMPDVRATRAEGFSLGATVAFTSLEFVVLWQDDGMNTFGIDEIYGQRIDRDGALLGANVKLVNEGPQGQTAPAIAPGRRSLGLTWVRTDVVLDTHQVIFAPFDFALGLLAPTTLLSGSIANAVYPVIVYSEPHYIVAWYDHDPSAQKIYGAVRDELGKEIVGAKIITQGSRHARSPALLPYGDRVLLVWADDRDGNDGYELYAKTLDRRLDPLGPEERITNARGDSIDPAISFGPAGDVGVLFRDNRTGPPQVFFTRFSCVPTTKGP